MNSEQVGKRKTINSLSAQQRAVDNPFKEKKKKTNNIDEMDEEELAEYEKTMAKQMKSYKFDSNY